MWKLGHFVASLAVLLPFLVHTPATAQQPAQESTLDVVKKRGVLIAGLRKDLPPIAFVDKQGQWVGFEVELSELIAKKLGVKLQRVEAGASTRIPLLVNGNIDYVMNGMIPSAERAKVIDFSMPYLFYSQKILTKKGSGIIGVNSLAGKKLGVTQGSLEAALIAILQPKAEFVFFQEWPQTVLALKNGKVDAVSTTDFILKAMAGGDPNLEILDDSLGWFPMMMGVRQNDSKWRLALDQAINEVWADGSYLQIYEKYFDGKKPPFRLPIWADYVVKSKH